MSKAPMKTASDCLTRAAQLVGGDRETTHGAKAENFANIAAVWNGILQAAGKAGDVPLDGHDVANLMEGMKIARRYSGAFNGDDYVDGGGYAGCAFEVKKALIHGG